MFRLLQHSLGVLIGFFIWVFLMLGFVYLALKPLDKGRDIDKPVVSEEMREKFGWDSKSKPPKQGYWNEYNKPRGEAP